MSSHTAHCMHRCTHNTHIPPCKAAKWCTPSEHAHTVQRPSMNIISTPTLHIISTSLALICVRRIQKARLPRTALQFGAERREFWQTRSGKVCQSRLNRERNGRNAATHLSREGTQLNREHWIRPCLPPPTLSWQLAPALMGTRKRRRAAGRVVYLTNAAEPPSV